MFQDVLYAHLRFVFINRMMSSSIIMIEEEWIFRFNEPVQYFVRISTLKEESIRAVIVLMVTKKIEDGCVSNR